MKFLHHLQRLTLAVALFGVVSSTLATAQPISPQDPYYKIPPAMTGRSDTFFVVGLRHTMYRVSASIGNVPSLADSIPMPSDLHGIWYLEMPNRTAHPDLIVGLASYNEGGSQYYGLIRSTDFGASWRIEKPAALRDPAFPVSGDYWRASLRRIVWLEDGQHGWLWGRRGILRTTNGGSDWDIVNRTPIDDDDIVQNDERVGALAFRDENNGVAVMGSYYTQKLYKTSDGGMTWTYGGLQLGQNRAIQIDWVNGEYRLLSADPFKTLDQTANTSIHFSNDAQVWNFRAPPIITSQTEMTQIFWYGDSMGVMVLRSGELWRSTNGGRKWAQLQDRDPSYPIEFAYYPGTKGFGQCAMLVQDGRSGGDEYIFEVSTQKPQGDVYHIGLWPVQLASSVPAVSAGEARSLGLKAYPNPAISSTDINFRLQKPSRVKLSLVDRLGDEVQQIDAGLLGAGEQHLTISLTGLPSGTYHYILDAEGTRGSGGLVIAR